MVRRGPGTGDDGRVGCGGGASGGSWLRDPARERDSADAHRVRHRHRARRRPAQGRAARARQRVRRRHVEPAVPADPLGTGPRVRDLFVHELLSPDGRRRRLCRHAAQDRGAGRRGDPRGVRQAGARGIERAGARRGEAADARAAGALPGGTHGSDVSFGGLSGLWRTVREPRSDARHRGRARSGRRRVRRGRVLRSRAAAGDLAGANDRLRGVTERRRENPSRKGVQRSMIVGVPREIKTAENRVALVPAGVESLVGDGHSVLVEQGAGLGSGFADDAYRAAGATLVPRPGDVWSKADMVVKVKEPIEPEWPCMRKGQVVFTYFHFAASEPLTKAVIKSGIVAIAYETVQLASGELPLLTPMSEVAGRMAVQEGAKYLEKVYGGSGILLGGVPGVLPAEVLIIGGGVVGANAAKMAAGLGARVTLLDLSLDRLRYLADVLPSNVDLLYSNRYNLLEQLRRADLVIGAVLLPGAKAPKLVRRDDLKLMKPGSVIVDVAVDQGGCIETIKPTTHENPVYVVDGIIHYGVANMPGGVPRTSTLGLTNATFPYAKRLARHGWKQACKDDPALFLGLNVVEGKVVYPAVAETFGLPSADPKTLV